MSGAVLTTPFLAGPRMVDGNDLNKQFNIDGGSSEDAVTAHAGGGQASAYVLTAAFTNVTTVASSADSLAMPLSTLPFVLNSIVTIQNNGANSLTLYTQVGDLSTLNGTAGATGISIANGKQAQLKCVSIAGAVAKWVGPVALA